MASKSTTHPEKIGKYLIEGVIGRGAMGVVYRGFDPSIERTVAVKTIRADLLVGEDGEDWLARFSREARAAGRCLHPNIVALFDYDQYEGTPFIAMEFIEGQELSHCFKEGTRFTLGQALDIMRQVLAALDYAHASGIVHRDIKPANVMLLANGSVKVTDFGIARLDTVNLTQHGSMIGTPSYMSPEQFSGKEVDHRSDLFSCGVLLFELLTGEKPFPGTTMTEIMYKVLHEHPRELSDIDERMPQALNDIARKALARDPAERYQSAAELSHALARALVEQDGLAARAEEDDLIDTGATVVVSAPPRRPEPAADPALMVSTIDTALLTKVEADLAVYMGPIARILVKKAAGKSRTPQELGDQLVRAIPDPRQGEEFRKRLNRTFAQPSRQGETAPRAESSLGSAQGSAQGSARGSARGSAQGSARGAGPGAGQVAGQGAPPDPEASGASLIDPEASLSPGESVFDRDDLKTAERALAEFLGPIAKVLVKKAAKQSRNFAELYGLLAGHLHEERERKVFLERTPED